MALENKYFIKTSQNGTFVDISALVVGCRILEIKGMFDQGKPVNIYTAQWIDQQDEDFLITKVDGNDNPVVIRENVDIEITFIVGNRYTSANIDVATQHDLFISRMTNSDIWIKSAYSNKVAHCVCLEGYEPTTIKLQRGEKSYMMGTLKLHTLDTFDLA